MRKLVIACVAASIAGAGMAARPAKTPKPPEASIPFVNHGGIHDWNAVDRRTLYIQDRQRHWYRATLLADCIDLDFADRIGFDAGPTDTLDRYSNIIFRGQRCPIQSLVASGPPPGKPRKR